MMRGGWRRQKPWGEIADDPRTPYMIGRLLGANEMAVALLQKETESDAAQRVSEVLARVVSYFMEEEIEQRKALTP